METTVIRTVDSSGKTIGKSSKTKQQQKQYNKNNNNTTSKQIKTTSLNTMLVTKFSVCAPTNIANSRYARHIYWAWFLECTSRVAVFYAVPACIFTQYRKLLDFEKCTLMFQISLTEQRICVIVKKR
jgi:hypothetical protein